MSLLSQFMKQLLQHHTGDVQIIDDNARMTTKQKSATLQLTRDSLHSSSLHSSNHSTTRWEMDGSNHSTEVRNYTTSLNRLVSVPTAPIRKPSNDPPQGNSVLPYESLDISSHKAEKRVHKYLGKNCLILSRPNLSTSNLDTIFSPHTERKSWNASSCPNKLTTLAEPTTAPNTPEPSPTPSRLNPGVSSNLIKPSRKASPVPPPSAFELNRSLSKTLLGMDDVNPQAPKIPTRRPSKQPDGNSPSRSSSTDAYSKMFSDISLNLLVVAPTSVGRKESNRSLVQQTQEVANTLPLEPPLATKNKFKPSVVAKPNSKWLGPLGKRN